MLVIGIVCIVLAALLHIYALWVLGIILAVGGAALLFLGWMGHHVGGRRWYY